MRKISPLFLVLFSFFLGVARSPAEEVYFLRGGFNIFSLGMNDMAEELRAKEQMSESESLALAAQEVALMQQSRISIPRRFTAPMRDMLALQPRFANRQGRRALKFLENRRFRAAYDFMMLRAEVGDVDRETAEFWTEVQNKNVDERQQAFERSDSGDGQRKRRRRPRRRRPPQAS